MLTLHKAYVPTGRVDVSGIDRAFQHLAHPLDADAIGGLTRKFRELIEITLHLDLTSNTARSESLQRLAHDRGFWLERHEHAALSGHFLIAIAVGVAEHPIAAHDPRTHLLARLTRVLLALKL